MKQELDGWNEPQGNDSLVQNAGCVSYILNQTQE